MYRLNLSLTALILGLLMISCNSYNDAQKEIYVSPYGDDSNPGTLKKPFLSLSQAASVAQAGSTVIIREGVYKEILRPANSGSEGQPIVFKSYEGEKVIVTAMEDLEGWELDEVEVYKTKVEWDLGQENMLIAEGVLCDMARWPNNTDGDPFSMNGLRNDGGSKKEIKENSILIYKEGIPDMDWSDGGWINFFGDAQGSGWLTWRSFIKESGSDRVSFDLPRGWVGSYHAPADKGEFFLQGIKAALDYQYEWYLDDEGFVYLQLPEGRQPGDGEVMMKRREVAIDLDGRDYIVIEGLAVFGGSIELGKDASNNVVRGITSYYGNFTCGVMDDYQTSSHSIGINGNNNLIENCEIAYGAGTGVRISGKNNQIINCNIHDFNYLGAYDAPVIMRNGENTVLSQNTIYNGGRDCIQFFHENSEVSYNDVHHSNLIVHDCCPIYTLGGPYNSEIHHNWFHDTYSPGDLYKACGIYLDNTPIAHSVHHNVVWNTEWTSIQINLNAKDLDIFNNTFWNGSAVMGAWRPKVGEFPRLKEDTKFENVRVWNNLANDDSWDPQTEQKNNLSMTSDPFVNSAEGDFRLKENTEPIDYGLVIEGITDGFKGTAPDVGAYEFGGEAWKAGITWDSEAGPVGNGDYGLLKKK
ncbi:right-handed parallel beta-helix repeat-containing protein [Bacteroidota bacterium]